MLTREIVGRTFGQGWHYLHLEPRCTPFLWHYHPEFELTLVRHAEGVRYIGDDVDPFGELDLALVAPNQAHTWYSHPRADGRPHHLQVIFFMRDWLAELAQGGLPEFTALLEWLGSIRQGVVFSPGCVAALLPAFERLSQTHGLARLTALLEIFDALPRDTKARHLGSQQPAENHDRRIETALAFLHQHFREPLSLAAVAESASVSEATLKRLFRQRLHLSFSALLIQLRVSYACQLLISTDQAVQQLAEESGFASPSHFYRQFRLLRGLSPAQFRRRYHLKLRDKSGKPPLARFVLDEGLIC